MSLPRRPTDGTTTAIALAVALSCTFLAWGCANVLGPWLSPQQAPAEFAISAIGASDADPKARGVVIDVLYVDGRRALPQQLERDPSWQLLGEVLFHDGQDAPASLRVRGSSVIACLSHSPLSGRVGISRDGVPLQTIDCHDGSGIRRVLHEFPERHATWQAFSIALLVLLAAAALLRPWRGDANTEPWVVLHAAAAHLLVWSGYPLLLSPDSAAYAQEFGSSFARGEAGYFPPGYSLFIELLRWMPFGGAIGFSVTALQSVLLVVTAVWLRRLLRAAVGPAVAFVAALLAGSAPIVLMMGHAVMSESLAYFGLIGALCFSVRASQSSGAGAPLLAGLLGGIAVVTRVTPLAVVLPFFAAHLLPSPRRGLRPFALSVATLAAVSLAPLLWFKAHGGRFEFANSSSAHVFNRLVHGGRLLDRDAPATQQLLDWLGDEDPREREHMFTTWSLLDKGHAQQEISDLMARVASESIAAHPWTYFTTSLVQAATQIWSAPAMGVTAWLQQPIEQLETAPLLGLSAPALAWVDMLLAAEAALWPGAVLLALLGGAWVLLRRRSRELLLLTWVVVAIALPESFIEIRISRRSAMFAPVLLALATIGIAMIARWSHQIWRGRRPDRPIPGAR